MLLVCVVKVIKSMCDSPREQEKCRSCSILLLQQMRPPGVKLQSAPSHCGHLQICLLENTRFHQGDTSNAPEFAAGLARLCDIFVCDAFGVVHRDQASVTVRGRAVGAAVTHSFNFELNGWCGFQNAAYLLV